MKKKLAAIATQTKKWQLSFVSGICIGIEEVIENSKFGMYSHVVLNTILPDTDEDYDEQKKEIEDRMKLICELYNNHLKTKK